MVIIAITQILCFLISWQDSVKYFKEWLQMPYNSMGNLKRNYNDIRSYLKTTLHLNEIFMWHESLSVRLFPLL